MTNQLITRSYNNLSFTFRDDGFFNMTKAAKHFGKSLGMFWQNLGTSQYLLALNEQVNMGHSPHLDVGRGERIGIARGALTLSQRGTGGGTWAHPKLAIFFARWLDVRFAVWCDAMIEVPTP